MKILKIDFFMRCRNFRLFLLVFLMMGGSYLLYNRLSDGFTVKEIDSHLPSNPAYAIGEISPEKKEALSIMLDQPFRYLGKGCQSYAFASEDGKYVVKFFKHKHLHPLDWLRKIPMPQFLRDYSEKKIAKRERRINNLFSGPFIAYQNIPSETGLIHIHLTRTPECKKQLCLIDKIGFKHEIDLDDHEYVLQKRAIPLKETFSRFLKCGGESEVKKRVQELAALVSSSCKQGIRDGDSAFTQNVGFFADASGALYMDVGTIVEDKNLQDPLAAKKELSYRLSRLSEWCEKNNPSILPLVDEEIASLVGQ